MDANGAMHALDLLREDCWREVIKKAWGPEDLKSCSETCTTFEGILENKKTTWMFHAVLPHILGYLKDWNSNEMYTCRRVCRGWRQSVDHYLEAHNSYFQEDVELSFDKYTFYGDVDTGGFLEMFEDYTGNPFVGRFIEIWRPGLLNLPQAERNVEEEPEHDYITNLRQILDQFGSEIWSVFTQYRFGWGQLSFCKNIQFILSMMPNLRSLQLGEGGNYARTRDTTGRNPEMSQLPAFLEANPLPDHPNLENLVLDALNVKMTRSLLEKYSPQLKRLQLSNPKRFAEKAHRFQCLKQLEIWSHDAKESLKAFRKLQSPLNILHIRVSYDDNRRAWPIHELIENIQHLPVTDLRIWISSRNNFEPKLSAFPDSLQNHSVRRIRLTTTTYAGRRSNLSCNFLRCFPNLAEIHFEYEDGGIPKPGPLNNLLIVKDSEEDMYESAVWDVLPHLQIITVKSSCSRTGKEYRRSKFEGLRLEKTKEILASLF